MILWIHVLAAITIPYTAGQRYQFAAARAMEVILLTGVAGIIMRASRGAGGVPQRFWTIVGLKVVGFALMAGLQTWQRILMNRQLAPMLIA